MDTQTAGYQNKLSGAVARTHYAGGLDCLRRRLLQGSLFTYIDQDILNEHEHERLQIDVHNSQVDFYFFKMKSTCSACSDWNLKINLFKFWGENMGVT